MTKPQCRFSVAGIDTGLKSMFARRGGTQGHLPIVKYYLYVNFPTQLRGRKSISSAPSNKITAVVFTFYSVNKPTLCL